MRFEIAVTHTIGERSIDVTIASDARLLAIVGPSGAGKSTLLNCIAGLITPRLGRIVIGGVTLLDTERGVNLPPERRGAGYVFQDMRLFPHLRVAGNLAYGERRVTGGPAIDRGEVIEVLGIGDLLRRWPADLSGGEQRRVAIGRALLSGARFLLLDEPLSSLDAARADQLRTMIERIRDDMDLPIVLVSHDRGEVQRVADQFVTLA